MSDTRTIKLRVRGRRDRATRFVMEDDQAVDYEGGETADVLQEEAIQKLATRNFDALEPLLPYEQEYLDALMDRHYQAKNGHPARFSDFKHRS
jgi:hypothetical protein